jgi:hypothetical protein
MTRTRIACRAFVAAWLAVCASPVGSAGDTPSSSGAAAPGASAPKEPVDSIQGTAPTETPQERMERFKRERGAGSDRPFDGFATAAAQEAERRRSESIGSAQPGERSAAEEALEAEVLGDDEIAESRSKELEYLQDKLASLGAWGASGCVTQEPDWGQQDDWIRHRKLARDDFQSTKEQKAKLAVKVAGATSAAYAAIVFSCALEPNVTEVRAGQFLATIAKVRYYAVLSRKDSYWSPIADESEEYTLGHEQLHFDIAESFARYLNQHQDKIRAKLSGIGKTADVATGNLQVAWAKHMIAVQNDFEAIQTVYDRDTKHGALLKEQTAWGWRVQDGFVAIAKGIRLETAKLLE